MQCNRPQSKNVCFCANRKIFAFLGFSWLLITSQIMTLVYGCLKSKNVCCGGLLAVGDSWQCQEMIFVLFLEKIFLKKSRWLGGSKQTAEVPK